MKRESLKKNLMKRILISLEFCEKSIAGIPLLQNKEQILFKEIEHYMQKGVWACTYHYTHIASLLFRKEKK